LQSHKHKPRNRKFKRKRLLDIRRGSGRNERRANKTYVSVGSETPLTEFLYCVTIAFTNLLPFNGDFGFGKSQKWQGAKYGL
jgi:hypothetical protein